MTLAVPQSAMAVPGSHELKFTLPASNVAAALSWLRLNCHPETPYQEGTVTSIYFDTLDWAYLDEKINSDYLKSKLRLRWYDTEPSAPAFVEVKKKVGTIRQKQRRAFELTASAVAPMPLDHPGLALAVGAAPALGMIPKDSMAPSLKISYRRWRFIDPASGLRLNLDCNIQVTAVNPRLLPGGRTAAIDQPVFEVKGDAEVLPPSLRQIVRLGGRRRAFSKYLVCWMAATNRTVL